MKHADETFFFLICIFGSQFSSLVQFPWWGVGVRHSSSYVHKTKERRGRTNSGDNINSTCVEKGGIFALVVNTLTCILWSVDSLVCIEHYTCMLLTIVFRYFVVMASLFKSRKLPFIWFIQLKIICHLEASSISSLSSSSSMSKSFIVIVMEVESDTEACADGSRKHHNLDVVALWLQSSYGCCSFSVQLSAAFGQSGSPSLELLVSQFDTGMVQGFFHLPHAGFPFCASSFRPWSDVTCCAGSFHFSMVLAAPDGVVVLLYFFEGFSESLKENFDFSKHCVSFSLLC